MTTITKEISFDEVFDSQRIYRLILDSMARPGKISHLPILRLAPPLGIHPASVQIAMTLLNADASFSVIGPDTASLTEYLMLNTAAVPADPRSADFLFVRGSIRCNEILAAKRGTLSYPEEGATVIVDVEQISKSTDTAGMPPSTIHIMLQGPGVEGKENLKIFGLCSEILVNLQRQNAEFPLGLDLIMTDASNQLVCIPRSSRFSISN